MAKRGFRIMDSDLHFNEPGDLWARYRAQRIDRAERPVAASRAWQVHGAGCYARPGDRVRT